MEKVKKESIFIYVMWFIAIVSTFGSLFFSEIMKYPPCTLCWYQRICMYPLVLIFFVGSLDGLKNCWKYAIPFVGFGLFFAIYHNLLHYEIISESAAPCSMGISCSTVYINLFGFLTIPMMSLIAFSILLILMLISKRIIDEK